MKTLLIIIFITAYGERTARVQEYPTMDECKKQLGKYKSNKMYDYDKTAHCIRKAD